MELGIFAKTFSRPGLVETFEAIRSHGLDCLQFNFTCAGLPTLPEVIDPGLVRRIRTEMEARSLSMAAVSGTCNLIHPDITQRAQYLEKLLKMIGICEGLTTSVLTLCTGTRNAKDMWRGHPDNNSAEAWRDLVDSLESLLPLAEANKVILGIEPEPANVINSARSARRLLDEMRSGSLKIIFDAANLIASDDLAHQREILSEACDLLRPDIVLAHAKDIRPERNGELESCCLTVAAGQGDLDYSFYLALLQKAGYDGPMILHSLAEEEVSGSVAFLRSFLGPNDPSSRGERLA